MTFLPVPPGTQQPMIDSKSIPDSTGIPQLVAYQPGNLRSNVRTSVQTNVQTFWDEEINTEMSTIHTQNDSSSRTSSHSSRNSQNSQSSDGNCAGGKCGGNSSATTDGKPGSEKKRKLREKKRKPETWQSNLVEFFGVLLTTLSVGFFFDVVSLFAYLNQDHSWYVYIFYMLIGVYALLNGLMES